jgi:spore coat protein U-like protein
MKSFNSFKTLTLATGAAALLATGFASNRADATTTVTASIAVSATVLSSCGVTALPLAFGTYSPTQSTNTTAQTTVAVTCTNGTPYNVGLNAGAGTGATVATRKMTSGSNTLNYSLYQDSGYSTVWGNTIGSNTVAGTGSGLVQTINVYGSATALQAVPAGAYTDTITVSLTY